MVEAKGGASDPEFTEVRMSRKEYNSLNDEIRRANESARSHDRRANERIAEARQDADDRIAANTQRIQEEADRKVKEAYDIARTNAREVADLRMKLGNEEQLNVNLQRIMIERANQARGITPKKAHDGYLVLKSRQWGESYTIDFWDTEDHRIRFGGNHRLAMRKGYLTVEKRSAIVCRSTLQTPYNATIPLDLIQERVMREDLWNKGILMELGCHSMCGSAVTGKYMPSEMDRNKNVLYRWIFEANYKSGLWELDIFTTKALTVPEHRRPTRRTSGDGKKPVKVTRKMKREEAATEVEDLFKEFGFDDFEDDGDG